VSSALRAPTACRSDHRRRLACVDSPNGPGPAALAGDQALVELAGDLPQRQAAGPALPHQPGHALLGLVLHEAIVAVVIAERELAAVELRKVGFTPQLCQLRNRDGALYEGWERWEAWLPGGMLCHLRRWNRVERSTRRLEWNGPPVLLAEEISCFEKSLLPLFSYLAQQTFIVAH